MFFFALHSASSPFWPTVRNSYFTTKVIPQDADYIVCKLNAIDTNPETYMEYCHGN